MSNERFWARVVFFTGLAMLVWNAYLLVTVPAGWAEKIFQALMVLVIALITWVAYEQSKR
jgi:hypothetical protein